MKQSEGVTCGDLIIVEVSVGERARLREQNDSVENNEESISREPFGLLRHVVELRRDTLLRALHGSRFDAKLKRLAHRHTPRVLGPT